MLGLGGEQPGRGRRGGALAGARAGREAQLAGVTGARGARAPRPAAPVIARLAAAARCTYHISLHCNIGPTRVTRDNAPLDATPRVCICCET